MSLKSNKNRLRIKNFYKSKITVSIYGNKKITLTNTIGLNWIKEYL